MKEPPGEKPSPRRQAQEQRALELRCVREVLAGNPDEFRPLVTVHKDRVFSMVLRMVGERPIAEELTQEIFVKAYTSLARFRFDSSFGTWITRIALNHTSNYFDSRRYKQYKKTVPFDALVHDRPEELSEPNKLLLHFRDALEDLKPALREVLVLCALEGKTYEEAALILSIPVGTVRSRLNRARERVRQTLEEVMGAA